MWQYYNLSSQGTNLEFNTLKLFLFSFYSLHVTKLVLEKIQMFARYATTLCDPAILIGKGNVFYCKPTGTNYMFRYNDDSNKSLSIKSINRLYKLNNALRITTSNNVKKTTIEFYSFISIIIRYFLSKLKLTIWCKVANSNKFCFSLDRYSKSKNNKDCGTPNPMQNAV